MLSRRAVLSAAAAAAAAGLAPAAVAVETTRTGVIDDVNLEERMIVINDAEYGLARRLRVGEEGRRRYVDHDALEIGRHVRFNVEGEGGGRIGQVVRIWLLDGAPPVSPE